MRRYAIWGGSFSGGLLVLAALLILSESTGIDIIPEIAAALIVAVTCLGLGVGGGVMFHYFAFGRAPSKANGGNNQASEVATPD